MSIETIFNDRAGNVIGVLDGRLMVQTRSVHLTLATLEAASGFLDGRTGTAPFGALAVVNGDAGVLPEAVRIKQREFITRLLGAGAYMATVVYGDTVHASTMRSMGRMMLLRQPRLTHHTDIVAAATYLAGPLALRVEDISDAVARLQRDLPPTS